MPDKSSDTSLKTWVLGILGIVISTVVIFLIEQRLTPKPAPPPPSHTIIAINGRVIDRAANRLIQNALVKLQGPSVNEQQNTDSEGRYAFSLEDFNPGLTGSMQIDAAGYKPLSLNMTWQELSGIQDQFLDASGPNPPAALRPGAMVGRYAPRLDVRRVATLVKKP